MAEQNKDSTATITQPLVAILGFAAFALGVGGQLCVPSPTHNVAQYTGRLTFLTVQTNWIGTFYFLGVILATIFEVKSLNTVLRRLFPLVFSLGAFLTIAYYALDHFNPKSAKLRQGWFDDGYLYVHWSAHVEHALALPAVLLYAKNFNFVPSRSDVPPFVGGYATLYLGFTHVLHHKTGGWVYPIFTDIQNSAGNPGLLVFQMALVSVFVALGYLGCWLTNPTSAEGSKGSKES